MMPESRYARSGDVHIAYQVVGDGPFDLVVVPGFVSHLEEWWEEPDSARFFQRLASFSRLIMFDKRGTGMSDRVPESALPTLDQRMDDVRAVMDAAGSERAVLLGASEGGPMSVLFAATYPERTVSLILYGAYARRLWAPDYPWGPTAEERQRYHEVIETQWGKPEILKYFSPTQARDVRQSLAAARRHRRARCATAIGQAVQPLGLEVRAGVHTGEIEVMDDDVGGIAVHIGARVAALAGPGEVLVSSTVKDLVAGAGLAFEPRGAHVLRGAPDEWRIFAVVGA